MCYWHGVKLRLRISFLKKDQAKLAVYCLSFLKYKIVRFRPMFPCLKKETFFLLRWSLPWKKIHFRSQKALNGFKTVSVSDLVVVVPEKVVRPLPWVPHHAGQVESAALLYVHLCTTHDLGTGLCKDMGVRETHFTSFKSFKSCRNAQQTFCFTFLFILKREVHLLIKFWRRFIWK